MSYANESNTYTFGTSAVKRETGTSIPARHAGEQLVFVPKTRPEKGRTPDARGYVAMLVLGLVAVAVCMAFVNVTDQWRRSAALDATTFEQIVVDSNDTLWSICEERPVAGMSISEEIHEIRRINNLEGSDLVAGQTLTVPAYAAS